MPIYEYECQQCGKVFETIRKFSDPRLTECLCEEKAPVTKLISAAAFHLKGSGWYVTDFRDKGKKDADKKDGDKDADGDSGGKSVAGDGTKDAAGDNAKDAAKDDAKSESSAKKGSGGGSKPAAAAG